MDDSKPSVGKRLSPVALIVIVYVLLHFARMLPDEIDIIPRGYLNTAQIDFDMSKQLTNQLGGPVTVVCPDDIPLRKGEITSCTAEDGYSRRIVRVTQNDSKGNITWQLTGQDAP